MLLLLGWEGIGYMRDNLLPSPPKQMKTHASCLPPRSLTIRPTHICCRRWVWPAPLLNLHAPPRRSQLNLRRLLPNCCGRACPPPIFLRRAVVPGDTRYRPHAQPLLHTRRPAAAGARGARAAAAAAPAGARGQQEQRRQQQRITRPAVPQLERGLGLPQTGCGRGQEQQQRQRQPCIRISRSSISSGVAPSPDVQLLPHSIAHPCRDRAT